MNPGDGIATHACGKLESVSGILGDGDGIPVARGPERGGPGEVTCVSLLTACREEILHGEEIRSLYSQKVPLTSVWKQAGGDSWGALHVPARDQVAPPGRQGSDWNSGGVPSMDDPWAWITMRLRSREWSNFLQRKGGERYFTFGVSKGELEAWWQECWA